MTINADGWSLLQLPFVVWLMKKIIWVASRFVGIENPDTFSWAGLDSLSPFESECEATLLGLEASLSLSFPLFN